MQKEQPPEEFGTSGSSSAKAEPKAAQMDAWDRNRSRQPDRPGFQREADHRGSKSRDQAPQGREMRKDKLDNALDRGLEGTFPASAPVSVIPAAGARAWQA